MSNKIYSGSAKVVQTKFGEMWKVSFSKSDLTKLVQYQNDNDTEWVNLVIKEKQQKVEGKPTHYLEVDEWKPNTGKEKNEFNLNSEKNEMVNKFETDALPF
jgi:hypothetical protein